MREVRGSIPRCPLLGVLSVVFVLCVVFVYVLCVVFVLRRYTAPTDTAAKYTAATYTAAIELLSPLQSQPTVQGWTSQP